MLSSLTKKLSALDKCLQKKNRVCFSPLKSYWVYKWQWRVSPIPSSKWLTSNKFKSVFVSFCVVWTFFNLQVFYLYIMFYDFMFLWYVCFICVCAYVFLVSLFYFANSVFFLFSCLFSKERERNDSVGWMRRWDDLGGDEGGERMIRIHCMNFQ